MTTRILFGSLLLLVGILYLWLAYMSIGPSPQNNDIVSWMGAVIFLIAGAGAGYAGINLVRTKRR